jgi:hypothetical protein
METNEKFFISPELIQEVIETNKGCERFSNDIVQRLDTSTFTFFDRELVDVIRETGQGVTKRMVEFWDSYGERTKHRYRGDHIVIGSEMLQILETQDVFEKDDN